VPRPRPRRAMRPSLTVRSARIVVPAVLVTALGVGVASAVMPGDNAQVAYPAPASTASVDATVGALGVRGHEVSRHIARVPIRSVAAPKPKRSASETITPVPRLKVTDSKYATTDLNLRTEPKDHATVVGVVRAGTKLSVTDTVTDGFRYVSYHDKGRWVTNEYLSDHKPTSESGSSGGGGFSSAPCPSGSSVESGLTPDAIRVHRAVCHRYPQVKTFFGKRASGGYHGQGRALDCMISDTTVGWDIAHGVRANAKRLGASEVIYRQHIWTVQRSSEGWRPMSDRGSPTANHMDHVHVSVYGNSGSG
jgi:hypothetical protein